MDTTHTLGLPYILPAQAQKHVTHNQALAMLDALVQLAVLDADRTLAPTSPTDGDRHLIGANPSGDWAGRENQLAVRQDGAWHYFIPQDGWCAWVLDEQTLRVFHDGQWQPVGLDGAASMLGVNASADETNRLAVSSDAVLFNHAGSDHQCKINKATPSDTASLLFQTGFSGHAEMGLAGDNDFHLKVSANGNDWHDGLVADAASGIIGFPGGLRVGSGDVLDLFASGSFTPQLTFATQGDLSVSYSEQIGVYWQLADLVLGLVHIQCTPTHATASGQLRITGLPVEVADPMVANTFQHSGNTTYPSGATTLVTRPATGTTYFTCLGIGPGVASTLSANNVPSGESFVARGLLVYRAAG